ncbi:MAG: hypothetical protein AVDCRST_MAG86-2198 [uncultured Truepera sp.]|uniref:Uncharacterized protein n=1 Tax=uncultured Truepera sp. TaxID=543023 RepID=A0A6J4VCT9_9DEIN|nr:MAG: hypothetical protein AVDCRST_MAG86-2198 [uncultured Truepera sp.]
MKINFRESAAPLYPKKGIVAFVRLGKSRLLRFSSLRG